MRALLLAACLLLVGCGTYHHACFAGTERFEGDLCR